MLPNSSQPEPHPLAPPSAAHYHALAQKTIPLAPGEGDPFDKQLTLAILAHQRQVEQTSFSHLHERDMLRLKLDAEADLQRARLRAEAETREFRASPGLAAAPASSESFWESVSKIARALIPVFSLVVVAWTAFRPRSLETPRRVRPGQRRARRTRVRLGEKRRRSYWTSLRMR